MLLDLCHTVNQFIAPLPESLTEFKDLMSTHLPNICDTKLMASTPPFKEEIPRSTLEEMIKTVSEKPFKMPHVSPAEPDQGYDLSDEKYHEAGYDAFVTGLCFLSMAQRLAALSAGLMLPGKWRDISPRAQSGGEMKMKSAADFSPTKFAA